MWTLELGFSADNLPGVLPTTHRLQSAFQCPHAEYSEYFQSKSGIKLVSEAPLRKPGLTWVPVPNTECMLGIQDLKFSSDFYTHKIALLSSFLLCIDCFRSALCNVTFPRQRKLLLLEMQVFLSHQALLAPCVNRWWIKAFNLWAQYNVCYQQTEPFSRQIEQTNCPCSKWHQKPLCFCLTKLTLCKI